jgi:hypothetical protein
MNRVNPREERERFRRGMRMGGSEHEHFDVKDVLVEARADAAPRALRAQVRYWQSMYELERERLVKLWLLYEDSESELAELRGQLASLEERGEYANRILRAAMSHDDGAEPTAERFPGAVGHGFERFDELSEAAPGPRAARDAGRVSDGDVYRYGPYTLYRLDVPTAGGGSGQFYFFARREPKRGTPSPLPAGCDIALNPVNGLPYVKKTAV